MANRSMEAKRIKLKKQRRAWAIPLSRKGGINPNRIVINEYKQRAKGLGLEDDISEGIIQRHARSLERQAALKRQAELELLLDEALCFKGPGPDNVYEESWIYFNSQKTAFFILHKDKRLCIERRSISYSCKEILITKWNMKRVTWVEVRDFSKT